MSAAQVTEKWWTMLKRKIVYICSPLRFNYERNKIKANLYQRYAYEKGCLPLAPHIIFPQFLDDENKSERRAGMDMGLQLLELCDELWVFGPRISEGMKAEIELARKLGKPTKYISGDLDE